MYTVSALVLLWGVIFCVSQYPTCAEDPCQIYSVLDDESRSVFTRNLTYYTRDDEINGWYVFRGKSGNRMLDYPPKIESGYTCTANVPGYMRDQHPKGSEGIVTRIVCFVKDGFVCWATKSIEVKNCGDYYVYNLKPLTSPDYLRYCGNGEHGVVDVPPIHTTPIDTTPIDTTPIDTTPIDTTPIDTTPVDKDAYQVTCGNDYIRIDLNRQHYDSSAYYRISLLDTTCDKELLQDHIRLGYIPGTCGSTVEETDTYITYSNAVILGVSFADSLITRESDARIYFKCSYKKDAFLTNAASFDPVGRILDTLEGFGYFKFLLYTYTTNAFVSPVTQFPVKHKLGDWLFFEVIATIDDDRLELFIEECYSTPTINHNDPAKYYLIQNRDPVDKTTKFIPATGLRRRFTMQTFRYKNTTIVYIHCRVFVCLKNSPIPRCKQGHSHYFIASGNDTTTTDKDSQ